MINNQENSLLSDLNEQQKIAAINYNGPSLVIAGPGSGKTKVIISRTAYMLQQGINGNNICLFTFTNKAAKEIKQRIYKQVGEKAYNITIGTYHSICVKILRRYSNFLLQFDNNFSIYDTDDIQNIIKDIPESKDIKPFDIISYIDTNKRKLISPSEAMKNANNSYSKTMSCIYKKYQDKLIKCNAMDFGDLLYYTIKLLSSNYEVLKDLNAQYQYIISDETQDANLCNLEFIKLLGGQKRNICLIADEDQSIYGFRGASLITLKKFRQEYKPEIYKLEQNYRCSSNILEASKSLIKKNTHDIDKVLFTDNSSGAYPMFFEEDTQQNESKRVLKLILFLNNRFKIENKDIAILYRMNYMSRSLEDILLRYGIKYTIVGGNPFYSRKVVKDLLSFLKIIDNKKDIESFKRTVNLPRRGIGESSINKILEYADNNNIDILQASKEIELKGKAKNGIKDYNSIINDLESQIDLPPEELLDYLINKIQYKEYIEKEYETEEKIEDQKENIKELINISCSFSSVTEMLQNIVINNNIIEEENDNNLNLLSMHSSKGLEFKAVIIIGANENICPHWRATSVTEMEEERRLFYVSMTRAEKFLFITRAKTMEERGAIKSYNRSRFISEIDNKFLKIYESKK